MEDELKQDMSEVVEKLLGYIETTESFVVEQAPLVVQEILIEPWLETLYSIPLLLISISICYCSVKLFSIGVNEPDQSPKGVFYVSSSALLCISGLFGFIKFGIILLVGIRDVLSATFTPRLYIIEYLKDIL